MTSNSPVKDWRKELGIANWKAPAFLSTKADIDTAGNSAPQAHALRRAFDRLGLDGILCLQNIPVAYFKEVAKIDPRKVVALHRQFWNQGLVPILVLIDDKEVHVYSGLARPVTDATTLDSDHRLIRCLNRVADEAEIRQFVLSIESGEFFRAHSKSFDPKQRVDRELLRSLQAARTALADASTRKLDSSVLDALLCRIVFVCYLFDRNAIGASYLESLGIKKAEHLRDILKRPKAEAKDQLYRLFKQLGADFNGDLFSDDLVKVLDRLQKTFKTELGSVELLRGVKVFDKDTLYLFKPLGQRFWTRTAALNDADDIATTVLLRSRKERK